MARAPSNQHHQIKFSRRFFTGLGVTRRCGAQGVRGSRVSYSTLRGLARVSCPWAQGPAGCVRQQRSSAEFPVEVLTCLGPEFVRHVMGSSPYATAPLTPRGRWRTPRGAPRVAAGRAGAARAPSSEAAGAKQQEEQEQRAGEQQQEEQREQHERQAATQQEQEQRRRAGSGRRVRRWCSEQQAASF